MVEIFENSKAWSGPETMDRKSHGIYQLLREHRTTCCEQDIMDARESGDTFETIAIRRRMSLRFKSRS